MVGWVVDEWNGKYTPTNCQMTNTSLVMRSLPTSVTLARYLLLITSDGKILSPHHFSHLRIGHTAAGNINTHNCRILVVLHSHHHLLLHRQFGRLLNSGEDAGAD